MKNKGKIIALDTEFHRLKQLSKRATGACYDIIENILIKKEIFKNENNKIVERLKKIGFDGILVDVPCSGIGTARRNPL